MFESIDGQCAGLDPDATLTAVARAEADQRRSEARKLLLAAHWADLHGVLQHGDGPVLAGTERLVELAGAGTPPVAEFCVAELGAELQIGDHAAARLVGDALELRHRLPRLWSRVMRGEVKSWVARRIADTTPHHSAAVAAHVDDTVTPVADRLGWTRLAAALEGEIVRADPEAADARARHAAEQRGVWVSRSSEAGTTTVVAKADAPDVIVLDATLDRIADSLATLGDARDRQTRRAAALGLLARPAATLDLFDQAATGHPDADGSRGARRPRPEPKRVVLYVHLSQAAMQSGTGVARMEDVGALTLQQTRRFLAGCQVTMRPVLDPAHQIPVDSYEVPARLREAVHLLAPADCFPYAGNTSRRLDLDHTRPYRHDRQSGKAPPGQTRVGNLAKLTRRHHRIKTHASGWAVRQPFPGICVWRSPHHRYYLVDHTGTRPLNH
jgi:hypothetical protein